ncbi:electron transporter SenC [Achromobacter seleniivolatilans]|uniref:Electron transporter SenC n=1 Tax=Achromobacter seleniivolatilans TaxID=3047478 RepID=A0ABY9LZV6_9BURK|nr:electron transporter SenC [Achromobacter sp. R39]WMD20020.1 electron transporter SenC [Achromobacter sp. R39]
MNAARIFWPLALSAGVLLSVWQWHESRHAPASSDGHSHLHDDSGKPARLYAWDAGQAARIVLTTPEMALVLTRGEQGWSAMPPGQGSGFDAADFVSLFSQARSDRVLTPHADESYGLRPPQLRIAISDASGGRLAQMDVGALAPDGLGRYVQLPGETQIRIIPNYQTRAALAAVIQVNPNAESPPSTVTLMLMKPALRKDK